MRAVLPLLAFRRVLFEGGSEAVMSTSSSGAAGRSLLRFLGGEGEGECDETVSRVSGAIVGLCFLNGGVGILFAVVGQVLKIHL